MKQLSMVLVLLILLTACAPSEGAIQTAIAGTQTVLSTIVSVSASEPDVPSQTPTPDLPPTITQTEVPTLTSTPTLIPASAILLQENFEDKGADGWFSWQPGMMEKKAPHWSIMQGPDGNDYASAYGIKEPPDIWYVNDKTLNWVDYAVETRVRFVSATKLKILTHANAGNANYVTGLFDLGDIYVAQWNSAVGYTDFGMTTAEPFVPNQWYTVRVEILGDTVRLYIDDSFVREQKLPVPLINKQGGIGYEVTGDEIDLDDIRVWSLQ
jgi:hypothetical protein